MPGKGNLISRCELLGEKRGKKCSGEEGCSEHQKKKKKTKMKKKIEFRNCEGVEVAVPGFPS